MHDREIFNSFVIFGFDRFKVFKELFDVRRAVQEGRHTGTKDRINLAVGKQPREALSLIDCSDFNTEAKGERFADSRMRTYSDIRDCQPSSL